MEQHKKGEQFNLAIDIELEGVREQDCAWLADQGLDNKDDEMVWAEVVKLGYAKDEDDMLVPAGTKVEVLSVGPNEDYELQIVGTNLVIYCLID